jgi:hypothetical protein
MTNTATLSEVQLRQFTGSENWYRHGINRAVLLPTAQSSLPTRAALTGCSTSSQSPSNMMLAFPAKSSRSGT